MENINHSPAESDDDESQDSGDDLSTRSSPGDRTHCLNCDMTGKAAECDYNDGENSPCNGCQRIPGARKRPLPCHSITNGRAQNRVNATFDSRDAEPKCAGAESSDTGPRDHMDTLDTPPQSREFMGTHAAKLLQQKQRKDPIEQAASWQRERDRKQEIGKLKASRKRARSSDDVEMHRSPTRRMCGGTPIDANTVVAAPNSAWGRQPPQDPNSQDRRPNPSASVYAGLLRNYCPMSTSQGHLSSSQSVDLGHESDGGKSPNLSKGRRMPHTSDAGTRAPPLTLKCLALRSGGSHQGTRAFNV